MSGVSWFPKKPPTNVSSEIWQWRPWFQSMWRFVRGANRVVLPIKTASFTADEDYMYLIDCDTAGANVVVTLPPTLTYQHKRYVFKKTDSSTYMVTFTASTGDTLEPTYCVLMQQGQTVEWVSDGYSKWYLVDRHYTEYAQRVASTSATGQTAAVGATTVYAVPANAQGYYRVSYNLLVTTAATTSSALGGTSTGPQTLYTDPVDSVVKTTNAGAAYTNITNTTGAAVGRHDLVYAKAGTNIQYSIGYTSVGATSMVYAYRVLVEFLGA